MPYIKNINARNIFNEIVNKLYVKIFSYGGIRGNLNYCIFKMFLIYKKKNNNYAAIADFLSELHECECEIRRRYLQPYEDKKIIINGDVE